MSHQPQAFEGLRNAGRKVRRPDLTLAVADHNVPTSDRSKGIDDDESRIQIETLDRNCADFGVELYGMDDIRQGICHVIGPEQGFTLPGTTMVCGGLTRRPMGLWMLHSVSERLKSNIRSRPRQWCKPGQKHAGDR